MIELEYGSSLENAKATLVNMKSSLDTYKAKENANEKFISNKEAEISHLAKFVRDSEDRTIELQQDCDERFSQGLKQGIKEANNINRYGRRDFFDVSISDKESVRASVKLNAMEKWPELY